MKCKECDNYSEVPLIPREPCPVCKSWLEKFSNEPKPQNINRISELVGENVRLKRIISELEAKLAKQKKENDDGK